MAQEVEVSSLGLDPNPDTKKKLIRYLKARNAMLVKQGYNLTEKEDG